MNNGNTGTENCTVNAKLPKKNLSHLCFVHHIESRSYLEVCVQTTRINWSVMISLDIWGNFRLIIYIVRHF
jgi:hypothetical protein